MNNLSHSEQETINEFVGIVGISLDSDDIKQSAISLLTHHNYNLNNAVLAFFETGLEVPTPDHFTATAADLDTSLDHGVPNGGPSPLQNLQNDFGLELFLPKLAKAPKISSKWQFDLGIHMSKKAFESSRTSDCPESKLEKRAPLWWLLVLIFPKTLSLLYSAFRYFFGLDLVLAPNYRAIKDKFAYEEMDEEYVMSDRLDPVKELYNLSFNDFNASHESSSQDYKFFLTILVNNSTESFLNKFLGLQSVKDYLNKTTGDFKETLIYVNNIDQSPEAFEVAKTYKAGKVPFVLLTGNVTRDPSIMSSMSIIYRANVSWGDEEETEFLLRKLRKNLYKHLMDYNPQLVTKRFDKQEIEFSRLIKEKQDAAYVESLNSDKIKKLEKENTLREKELQMQLSQKRSQFILKLVTSKYFENKVQDVAASDIVRISIKLPHGKRIVQKFHKDSHMCELYLFVETKIIEDSEGLDMGPDCDNMTISDFIDTFSFSFELFKPFPKCVLPATLDTIAQFGDLKSGDNVLFEYGDENSGEESDSGA